MSNELQEGGSVKPYLNEAARQQLKAWRFETWWYCEDCGTYISDVGEHSGSHTLRQELRRQV